MSLSACTPQLSRRSRKLMPSRLVFICPRGTTSAGTDFSTSWPTARRSSVSRAALVRPPAVSTSTLYSSISSGNPIAFAVSQVSTTEVAPVSMTMGALTPLIRACSANSQASPPQHLRYRIARALELVRIAIGDDGAGGRSQHQENEQDAAHGTAPLPI